MTLEGQLAGRCADELEDGKMTLLQDIYNFFKEIEYVKPTYTQPQQYTCQTTVRYRPRYCPSRVPRRWK